MEHTEKAAVSHTENKELWNKMLLSISFCAVDSHIPSDSRESPRDSFLLSPFVWKGHCSSLLGPFCAAAHPDQGSFQGSLVPLGFQETKYLPMKLLELYKVRNYFLHRLWNCNLTLSQVMSCAWGQLHKIHNIAHQKYVPKPHQINHLLQIPLSSTPSDESSHK